MPRNGSETLPLPGISPPATLTSAASSTCAPATSPDMTNAIFSPGSAAGRLPCGSPAGATIAPSGPAPAPVSRSVTPGNTAAFPTSVIFGLFLVGSSESADLQQSLESRLQARLASLGSTLYRLTWKARATPLGRLICALRASALPMSVNDCSLWPTPSARDWKSAHASIATLTKNARPLNEVVRMREIFPTPRAIDGRRKGNGPRRDTLMGYVNYDATTRERIGSLNPQFSAWLMGFPPEWLSCAPSETRSSRKSPPSSSPLTGSADHEGEIVT